MKAYVFSSVIGVLGLNENAEIIEKALFAKNTEKIAESLSRIESGELIPEFREVVEKLIQSGYRELVLENESLANEVKSAYGVAISREIPSSIVRKFQRRIEDLCLAYGFVEKKSELHKLLHDVSLALSRIKIKKASERRDLLVIQSIEALDDLDKTLNILSTRVQEWYGYHFPELKKVADKHELFLQIVSRLGRRENFTLESLREIGVPKDKAIRVMKLLEKSTGISISEEDMSVIRNLASLTLKLYERRRELEKYISDTMDDVAPNIKAVIGPLIGARLIALAGGLENLSKMPASTIQILGAEKALFRALRTGTKPPKHGVIFQSPYIHTAPKWQRGKIARAMAGKIAIAARVDVFGNEFIGNILKEELEKRIDEIKKKYSMPPRRKAKVRKYGRRS